MTLDQFLAMYAVIFAFLALPTRGLAPSNLVRVRDMSDAAHSLTIVEADSETTGLHKRWGTPPPPPCSDGDWQAYKNKGCTLLAMIAGDDAKAGSLFKENLASAASEFQDFPGDLDKWDYKRDTDTYCDMSDSQYGMETALKGLGISTESKNWKCYKVTHGELYGRDQLNDQKYDVDGKTYRATGAQYTFPINVNDGVLVITKQYSPEHEGQYRSPPVQGDGLPKLKRSSDISFGQWSIAAKDKAKQIRFIIVWSVRNRATPSIIRRALQSVGQDNLKKYPQSSFDITSDAGKALLGSPNGVGVAYFLVQRKALFGEKKISKVDIFGHTSVLAAFDPVMVFHLEDA